MAFSKTKCLSAFKWNLSFKLSILLIFFAVCSWVAIDSIFIELPILVKNLPEEWSLPSYLGVTTQLGNVGTILYMVIYKYQKKRINDASVIYGTISLNIIFCILIVFTWSKTINILQGEYSIALLLLSFLLATMSCTSTVTFFPYMSRFKAEYLSVFYFGLGMSGLFPSFISMIQGAGGEEKVTCPANNSSRGSSNITMVTNTTLQKNSDAVDIEPRFGAEVFFTVTTGFCILGLLSFIGLNKLKFCRKHMVPEKETPEKVESVTELCASDQKVILASRTESFCKENSEINQGVVPNSDETAVAFLDPSEGNEKTTEEHISRFWYYVFMILLAWMSSMVFGIIPALLSYASLPYGTSTYHMATVISRALEPLSYVTYHWLPMKSPKLIALSAGIATLAGGYIVMIAAMSPCPILSGAPIGGVIVVSRIIFI